jgi:ribose 5-phosphate isomerase RpiB
MNGNGQPDAQVLCWPRRVLSADDLRRHLTSQRELQLLPRTIITPLAADELKMRGIRITWQDTKPAPAKEACPWGYAQERHDVAVTSAVQALERDGIRLAALEVPADALWKAGAGAIVFCGDPSLVCCVANKYSGVRAAVVATPQAAARARQTLGANLFAIEMPGRTFFELRQILRTICAGAAACPTALARTLKELDGHAHC